MIYWCNFQLCWWWRSSIFHECLNFKIHVVLFCFLTKAWLLRNKQEPECILRERTCATPGQIKQKTPQTQQNFLIWHCFWISSCPYNCLLISSPGLPKDLDSNQSNLQSIDTEINKCNRQAGCCELMAGHLKGLYFRWWCRFQKGMQTGLIKCYILLNSWPLDRRLHRRI